MTEKAKGKRPTFADEAQVDHLVAMVMALAGEVSVLRERVDAAEQLLVAAGAFGLGAIDGFEPDAVARDARMRWRAGFLDRLLRSVHAAEAEASAGETDAGYTHLVSALARERDE